MNSEVEGRCRLTADIRVAQAHVCRNVTRSCAVRHASRAELGSWAIVDGAEDSCGTLRKAELEVLGLGAG